MKKFLVFLVIIGIGAFAFYRFKLSDKPLNNDDDTEQEVTTNPTSDKVNSEQNTEPDKPDFKIETIDGVTYIDGILIVNKTYPLPETFKPTNTYIEVTNQDYCVSCIDKVAYEAYQEMKADAASLGLNIYIQSGYRSYQAQERLYKKYIEEDGQELADTYSARPGASEHQSGLCFDLNSVTDAFADTEEGKWVQDSAYKYGFIIRFPKGKEKYTGYKYESWHLRYVGKTLAEKLYNNGDWISLEEYFGIDSQYPD